MGLCEQPIYRWTDVFKADGWWINGAACQIRVGIKRNQTIKRGTLGSPLPTELIKFSTCFKQRWSTALCITGFLGNQSRGVNFIYSCPIWPWKYVDGVQGVLSKKWTPQTNEWVRTRKKKQKISGVSSSPALWLPLVGSPGFHGGGRCASWRLSWPYSCLSISDSTKALE